MLKTLYFLLTLALSAFLISVGAYKARFGEGDEVFHNRFVEYAKVFPGNSLHPSVTPHIDPVLLRHVVGVVEIVFGVLGLGIFGRTLNQLAAVGKKRKRSTEEDAEFKKLQRPSILTWTAICGSFKENKYFNC